jgi:hypothetical protein
MLAAAGTPTSSASTDYPFGWSARQQPNTTFERQFDPEYESTCGVDDDHPDEAVRAFKFWNADHAYRVQLNFGENTQNKRMVGWTLEGAQRESSLDGPEQRPCNNGDDIVLKARNDPSPGSFANKEYLSDPYHAPDGKVYAVLHNEFHGASVSPPLCTFTTLRDRIMNCWFASMTLVSSNAQDNFLRKADFTCIPENSPTPNPNRLGSCYSHSANTAQDLVATIPYRYCTDWGRAGYSQHSNILKGERDLSGYYLQLALVEPPKKALDSSGNCVDLQQPTAQRPGVCLLRTDNLSRPSSWMAWDGTGYNSRPSGAYSTPTGGVCEPLKVGGIGAPTPWSLTYNRYLNKYMWLGQKASGGSYQSGVYYSLSDDLINWSDPQFLMRAPTNTGEPDDHSDCQYDAVGYPVLLDPTDPASRWRDPADPNYHPSDPPNPNFDHPGRKPDLYFAHFTRTSYQTFPCGLSANAGLGRIKIEFKQRVATISNGLTEDPDNPPDPLNPDRGFDSIATSYMATQVGCNPPEQSCFNDYDTEATERSFFTFVLGTGVPQYGFGQIGQANDGTGGMPLGWKNGDDVWYGAAFYLPSGFAAGTPPLGVDLLRWEDSNGLWSGIRLQADQKRLQLVANNLPLDTTEFDAPEGRWFWLEVHQKLGATSGSGTLNEVFLDGRLVSKSSTANRLSDTGAVMRVRYGLVSDPLLSGRTANLFVDRASVTAGPLGALKYAPASENVTASQVGVPKTPIGFKVQPGSNTFSWNGPSAGDQVNGYRIYMRQSDGTWSKVGGDLASSTTSVTESCGQTYRITAFRNFSGGGGESLYSAAVGC